jgi:hypothetical protein
MSKSAQVQLNIEELKGFMTHMVNTNRELQENNKFPVTVEVEGESGIGKTSAIKQLAEEVNYDFIKVNLAQLDELGDIIGYPTRQFQMAKNVAKDGDAPKYAMVWADEAILSDYKEKGYAPTGKDKMAYSLPEWVPTHDNGALILFDDYNRAQQRFLQAVMEILDRQEYISWKMPKNCTIVLSSNPDNGDYQVQSQDTAQKTRYVSIGLKFDKEVWGKWAESAGIDGRCINFLLLHPELVTKETNARAITTFFNSISSFSNFEENLSMIQMIGEGSVGEEFSNMFVSFINNKLDKLVAPDVMLTDKDEEKVKRLLKEAIGIDHNYRADIASVLCTRFTNHTLVHAREGNPVNDDIIKRITMLTTESLFGNDLQYYAVREILSGEKQKFQKLMMNPEVVKMAVK